MEVAAGLIKLNLDADSKVAEWRDTMTNRMEEALATLVHEGAQIESWFRVKIDGQDYLLWYMRAESMKKVFEVSRTFKHSIDKYHYDLMDRITAPKGNIAANLLLDLSVR
jgi:Family of unknown function (DUF6176)